MNDKKEPVKNDSDQEKENLNISEALKHQTLNMDIEDLAEEQADDKDADGKEKATANNSSD